MPPSVSSTPPIQPPLPQLDNNLESNRHTLAGKFLNTVENAPPDIVNYVCNPPWFELTEPAINALLEQPDMPGLTEHDKGIGFALNVIAGEVEKKGSAEDKNRLQYIRDQMSSKNFSQFRGPEGVKTTQRADLIPKIRILLNKFFLPRADVLMQQFISLTQRAGDLMRTEDGNGNATCHQGLLNVVRSIFEQKMANLSAVLEKGHYEGMGDGDWNLINAYSAGIKDVIAAVNKTLKPGKNSSAQPETAPAAHPSTATAEPGKPSSITPFGGNGGMNIQVHGATATVTNAPGGQYSPGLEALIAQMAKQCEQNARVIKSIPNLIASVSKLLDSVERISATQAAGHTPDSYNLYRIPEQDTDVIKSDKRAYHESVSDNKNDNLNVNSETLTEAPAKKRKPASDAKVSETVNVRELIQKYNNMANPTGNVPENVKPGRVAAVGTGKRFRGPIQPEDSRSLTSETSTDDIFEHDTDLNTDVKQAENDVTVSGRPSRSSAASTGIITLNQETETERGKPVTSAPGPSDEAPLNTGDGNLSEAINETKSRAVQDALPPAEINSSATDGDKSEFEKLRQKWTGDLSPKFSRVRPRHGAHYEQTYPLHLIDTTERVFNKNARSK